MKEAVLALLRENEGDYISGETMSEALGISRAAIWKDIKTLQEEGFRIEAATKKGYRLLAAPDVLREGNLLPLLRKDHRESLICFETIESTNNTAKQLAQSGQPFNPDGYYLVAAEQTGGRGRRGRSFYSPAGKGLYLTGLYLPSLPVAELSRFTAFVAVAVCEAIETCAPLTADIKWPNDVLAGGKKLCGILTEIALESESAALQYLITGIGINVSQQEEDFPEEFRAHAASIGQAAGAAPRRDELCAALINALDDAYAAFTHGGGDYWQRYRSRCVTLDQDILLISGESRLPVHTVDIAEDFGLIVRRSDGTLTTEYAGEVSVR